MYKTIYVTDNDPKACEKLVSHLNECEYVTTFFQSSLDLLMKFAETPCNLIIIDSDANIINGYDFTREIRKKSDVPIIMVSERKEKESAILAFDAGCDDFIQKPLNLREISTKVKIIFKRMNGLPELQRAVILSHHDLEINLNAHTATIKNQSVSLTPKEFNLLILLMEHKNQVFSREQIIHHVWLYDSDCDSRQVDHLIKRLRKKIKQYSDDFQIETVWGLGYKLST